MVVKVAGGPESDARIVKFDVPDTVGVPMICPVDPSSTSPVGSGGDPGLSDHVTVPLFPAIVSVAT